MEKNMARQTLEMKLADAKARLKDARSSKLATQKECKPAIEKAEVAKKSAAKVEDQARAAHGREREKALSRARWTEKRALSKLQKFAGLTDEDIEENAHHVPGHDLLQEARHVVTTWVLRNDFGYRITRQALDEAQSQTAAERRAVYLAEGPIRALDRIISNLRGEVDVLEIKIAARDGRKQAKAAYAERNKVSHKEAKVVGERRKSGRKRLRTIVGSKFRWGLAAKIPPDVLKELGLVK